MRRLWFLLLLLPQHGAAAAGADGWVPVIAGQRPILTHSIAAGDESGMALYVCRGVVEGGVHPGRYRQDFDGCHIGYNGHELDVTPFSLLTAPWQRVNAGEVPNLTEQGGAQLASIHPGAFGLDTLFVCAAPFRGGLHPGQVRPGSGCSFGYGGRAVTVAGYDTLQAMPWMAWVPARPGALPSGVIVGGAEGGQDFAICRAPDHTGLHIGKVKAGGPGCSVGVDGKEEIVDRFDVLVTRWVFQHGGRTPVSAVPSGQEDGGILYVCRAQSQGAVEIGKVDSNLGGCHVGMQNREVVFPNYEVLSQ